MSPTIAPRALAGLPAAALMLVLLAAPARVPALDDDQDQPLYLEADSAELDEAKALSIYTGNVFIKQGSMEIRGDQVTVHHDPQRKPKRIVAVGEPAKYRQKMEGEDKEIEAEALRMEYDAAKDEITLIDRAVLFQGQDWFRSDRIVYDRAKGRVKAGASVQGKERVKITITPSRQ
jgi:lipopolysaccharide export system protein LptA